MNRIFYLIGLGVIACGLLAAGESVVLRNGFRMPADRHEVDGGIIRIFAGDGVTEMPVGMVASVDVVASEDSAIPEAPHPAEVPPAAESITAAAPAPSSNATPAFLAESAARKYSLPPAFVAGVMRAESGFNPAAVSPKGAIGLMQLMPATARDLGIDPTRPGENADAGTRYLRDLLALYEDKPDQVVLALAAYNAGPAAVEKYHGVPPYRETREYILRVLKAWDACPPSPTVPGRAATDCHPKAEAKAIEGGTATKAFFETSGRCGHPSAR